MKAEDVATSVIDEQVAAYNARDLRRFVATYHDDIEIFRPPATDPVLRGKQALADFYATNRFCHAGLRAEILHRMVMGNIVTDHERIHGLPIGPMEVILTYEVQGNLIRRAWSFARS